MEEDIEQTSNQEQTLENEEPTRTVPSLLNEDLNRFRLKDSQVLSLTELVGELKCGFILAWRKAKPRSEYLSEVFVVTVVPLEISLECVL